MSKLLRLISCMVFVLLVISCKEVTPDSKGGNMDTTSRSTGTTTRAIIPSSEVIVFPEESQEQDNLVYLMAAGAERNSEMSVTNYGFPKHFWVNNFNDQTDYFRWNVQLPEGATYRVWALLESSNAIPLELSVDNTQYTLSTITQAIGWDKLDMGTIYIPAGNQQLKIVRNGNASGNIQIKSLELIREDKMASYEQRVQDFKKGTSWLSQSDYGIMFQYGAWGYPQSGDRKTIDQGAADFDVPSFIDMVKSTGASYVVWSLTWHQFWMQAPISSFDTIMGHSNFTSERDLVGEIAQSCKDNGIRFMLYYHQGLQEEPTWAEQQNWPSEFTARGTGDRSTFFNNWCAVISEVGNRYGTNLDGFFFDDGCVYYPAPFEKLGEAARAGNPDRLISYNPWVSTRITEFQDVNFGEGHHGTPGVGAPAIGGNGILTDGPNKGLLDHGMFIMEQDWGVHRPQTTIQTKISQSQALHWLNTAEQYNVPLTFNMMMYEDGTVSQDSLNILYALKNRDTLPENTPLINNTHPDISYQGAWQVSSNRNVDDYMNDVHYTEEQGAYFEYTFTGTGIEYITETNSDMGEVDIYLDGVFQKSVECYSNIRRTQQVVYSTYGLSLGTHTLKVVKKSGDFMLLDALFVSDNETYVTIANRTDELFLCGGGTSGNGVIETASLSGQDTLWQIIDLGDGYKTIRNVASGLVLNGGGGYNGYAITEWHDVTSTNLQWSIVENEDGYATIKNRTSGYVLNGGGGADGYPVTEWKDLVHTNLQWRIKAYR